MGDLCLPHRDGCTLASPAQSALLLLLFGVRRSCIDLAPLGCQRHAHSGAREGPFKLSGKNLKGKEWPSL